MFNRTRVYFLVFIIVAVTIMGFLSTVNYKSRVTFGGKTFSVDVADTVFTQAKGLSFRKSLGNNEGMIFVFEQNDKHGFWMKDMNFSIDMIWIDENFKIVHIEKSVSPQTYPKVFYPDEPAKYVLEVRAGQSDLQGVREGDSIVFMK